MTPSDSPHALARRAQNDSIRTLYEDTLVPVREIARLAGVTERNIYALVRRLGCRPRVRLATGGGRRIMPFENATDAPLDAESVQRVVQRCDQAVQKANGLAAAARVARDDRAAKRLASRAAGADARTLALMVRAMRDLAALTDEPEVEKLKPKKRREWKPGLVSWPRPRGPRLETLILKA